MPRLLTRELLREPQNAVPFADEGTGPAGLSLPRVIKCQEGSEGGLEGKPPDSGTCALAPKNPDPVHHRGWALGSPES